MKQLPILCPKSMEPHYYDAFSSKGLVYAVNCSPKHETGVGLWRPALQSTGTALFDPLTEQLLDLTSLNGEVFALVQSTSSCVVRKIDSATITVSDITTVLPPAQEGTIRGTGNTLVVGLEEYGVFVIEKVAGAWEVPCRIGSVVSPSYIAPSFVTWDLSSTTSFLEADWSDPALADCNVWVGKVTMMVARDPDGTDDSFSLELVEDVGGAQTTHVALETYHTAGLYDYAGANTVWTELIFTFQKKVKMPIQFKIKGNVGTTARIYLATYNKVETGAKISVSGLASSGLQVSGAMCPNGSAVGTYRGLIFGTYKGSKLQIADIFNLEFDEEVPIGSNVVALDTFWQSLYVLTESKVVALAGWSAKGVEFRQVMPFGIARKSEYCVMATGIYVYSYERLFRISGSSPVEMPKPSLIAKDTTPYLVGLETSGVLLIGFAGYEMHKAYYEVENGYVFWRFDEADVGGNLPHAIASKRDIVVLSDGRAYRIGNTQVSGQYETEVHVASEVLPELKKFRVQEIELNGSLYFCDPSLITIFVTGFEDNQILTASVSPQAQLLPLKIDLPSWYAQLSEGLPEIVPENEDGTLRPLFFVPKAVFGSEGETYGGGYGRGWFLSGRKFIVGVKLDKNIPKHPGNVCYGFNLYGELEGSGTWGAV